MHSARTTLRTVLATLVAASLAVVLLPASPAAAAKVTVDKRFFGIHDTDPTSWPAISVGSLRLWDAGVTWADIQPEQGRFDWSRLDAIVSAAQARNVEVTLVLGQTPAWADDPASLGVGPQYMPLLEHWTNYISAVVERYKSWNGRRGIAAYQVWNEANIVNYWGQNAQNSPAKMGQLTSAAYRAVKAHDPGALVIGPAFGTRLAWQRKYLGYFYGQRVDGVPIWRRMDAISLNLYPVDTGTPESSMTQLAGARTAMTLRGVPSTMPIWNTEVNYGLATGGSGASTGISAERQASYVLRTFLLNAANGVKRVDWYIWDRPDIGSTKLLSPSTGAPTLAGNAVNLAQAWMLGGTMVGPTKTAKPCTRDRAGTYTCVITYSAGVRRVYWNPTKKVKVTTAKSATFRVGVYGKRIAVKGGSRVTVDYRPVMVRSKR